MQTITIDINGWTQQQKNMAQAALYNLIWTEQGKDVKVVSRLPYIDIYDDTVNITNLTTVILLNKINENINTSNIISENMRIKYNECVSEIKNSTLMNITLSQIDAAIDNISNLSDAKVFLKKLTRYIKAKEIIQ